MSVPLVFRVESCVWLCHGFSGSNPGSEAPIIIIVTLYCSTELNKRIFSLGITNNIAFTDTAFQRYQRLGTKCNTTVFTVFLLWSYPGNGAKCDTIVVMVLLLWSYPDNGTKRDTKVCNGSFLWPSFRDHHMRSQVVCLLIHFVPTICLKDLQIGNDSIHSELFFLTVRVIRWNKVARVLMTQRQEELFVND